MSRTTITAQLFSQGVIEGARDSLVTEQDYAQAITATERAPTLAQLAKLLVDPHSAFMTERHEKYTNRLIQFMVNRGGVLLSELVELFKVIELFEERIEKNTVYGECLIEFINLMGGALLKSKTSDEQQYMRVAIDAMEQLALLLRVPFLNVRKSIIETILSFWEQRPNVPIRRVGGGGSGRGGAGMYRTCSKEFHEAVIEHSKVVSTLVQAMPLLQPDEHILALVVLEQLTRNSAANVASIVSCRGAQLIALLLPEAHKSHVPMLIDILWHCVQHAQDKTKCIEQLSARTSISALNAVFERIMKSAHSKAEKETRNDLLVLMTQLARHNPSAPFVETSFLREIISFGCSGERNLTNSEVDFEFLRMLLTCAVILAEGDGAALRHVKATKLLDYLLLPVQQLEERKKETRSLYQWSGAQKEELQLLSLQLLTKLAPRMKDKFVEQNGCQLLMSFLFWSFQTDYMGHGNSILAMGGRGSARAQCRFCLRCIRSLCTPLQEDDATGIIEGFVNEGIVDLLLLTLSNVNGIDQDPASDSFVYIEDDHIDLEIQEDMLVILSLVADINQKEMMNSNLIPILVYYLRTLPGRVVNGVRRQQLLLSVLDCIFSAVLGHEEAEIAFLEKEGAFLLIDLLEHLPQEMHSVVLTALIELTENPASMTHLMTWRSSQAAKGDQPPLTLVQLLVKLWREEEKRIGAHRGSTGQLTNVDYPMAGAAQIRQSTNHNQSELSPALAEMGENVRAKIYCLMFRIGFNDQLPGVTTGDYVTLALIEKYYDFKVSEVWNEVIDELTQEGISLIDADSEAAETIKQAQSERAKGIQNLQDQLKQAKIMQDKADEQFLFEKIREKYRQSARLTARWYDYIERTSNYSKLEAAKAEMSRQIEQSKTRSKENQKTINHLNRVELNTTTFQGRHMYVESTPSAITRTPDPQY